MSIICQSCAEPDYLWSKLKVLNKRCAKSSPVDLLKEIRKVWRPYFSVASVGSHSKLFSWTDRESVIRTLRTIWCCATLCLNLELIWGVTLFRETCTLPNTHTLFPDLCEFILLVILIAKNYLLLIPHWLIAGLDHHEWWCLVHSYSHDCHHLIWELSAFIHIEFI